WAAADVFACLSDGVTEVSGPAALQAMARGLPVVASDWDGHRDFVVEGQTGFLVPTRLLAGAAADYAARLLTGGWQSDHFLAACSQTVAVDCVAAVAAFTRLLSDADLRARLGAAGRARAQAHFSWADVVKRYDALFAELEAERAARAG